MEAELWQAARNEALRLEEDILYTVRSHFAHEQAERRAHWLLGLGSAMLSVLAAAAVVRASGGPLLPGSLALGATLCSAVLTFAKPAEAADSHARTATSLNALRVELRQYRELTIDFGATEAPEMRAALKAFADRKASLDADARSISERRYRQAGRKLRKERK